MIEIRNRWTCEVMHAVESETIRGAVVKLLKRGANLRYADLRYTNKVPMFCNWTHGISEGDLIHIGCEKRTIEEWDKFFDSTDEIKTKRGTYEFKQIEAVYNAYKAYLLTIKNESNE